MSSISLSDTSDMLGEEMGDTISLVSLLIGCCFPLLLPQLLGASAVASEAVTTVDVVSETGSDTAATSETSFSEIAGGGGETLLSEDTLTLVEEGDSSLQD